MVGIILATALLIAMYFVYDLWHRWNDAVTELIEAREEISRLKMISKLQNTVGNRN